MNRDDILRMAREAGFITGTRDYADGDGAMPFVQSVATGTFLPELERFYSLAVERERTARQEAQAENEELKARLARAGVEQRRAVWRERMECAGIVRANAEACTSGPVRDVLLSNAEAIVARNVGGPDLRPSDTHILNCPTGLRPDQQLETLVTGGYAGDVLGIDGQWVPTITQVAIRYNGNIYAMPAPYRHHDVIRKIGGIAGPDTQGFLTNRGGFLTRTEAMQVAVTAGQLKRGPGGYQGPELFSEDLW